MKHHETNDISAREQNWLDVFSGEEVVDADPGDVYEAKRIRHAFSKHLMASNEPTPDEQSLFSETEIASSRDALRRKLMNKGALPAQNTPAEQSPKPMQQRFPMLAMAAMLALGVGVGLQMQLFQNPTATRDLPEHTARGLGDGVFYLQVGDPARVAQTLAGDLQGLGIEHMAYELDGKWYVEVELPAQLPAGLEVLESRYGIGLPAGESILVEFRQE